MNYPVPDHIKLQKGSEYISVPGYSHALAVDDSILDVHELWRRALKDGIGENIIPPISINAATGLVTIHRGRHLHIDIKTELAHTFKTYSDRQNSLFAPEDIQADMNAIKAFVDMGRSKTEAKRAFVDAFQDDLSTKRYAALTKFIQEYQPEPFVFPDRLNVKMPESKPVTFTFIVKPKNLWQGIKLYFKARKWKFSIR